MYQFIHKTRGMQNPRGKQKVFWISNEEDYESYFDTITDELLNGEDLAIFALKDAQELLHVNIEELGLEEMKLFVLVVSKKLLNEAKDYVKQVVEYADRSQITILPILLQAGIETDLNEICGSRHVIFRNETNLAVYLEKLNSYIQELFFNANNMAALRAEYRAYLFLSYRKMNRKNAEYLMKKIHQIDAFLDIAIWYDEFLTPGENFDDEIEGAIQKAQIFLLLVTPDLVNSEYIRKYEYTKAKELGKIIVPVMVEPTDLNTVYEAFEGLPKVIDIRDEKLFRKTMMSALAKISLKKKSNTPIHNYCIGVGYFTGVDVEKNREKGLQLLEKAAKAGEYDAIRYLYAIYFHGFGVTHSMEKAMFWHEKMMSSKLLDFNQKMTFDGLKKVIDRMNTQQQLSRKQEKAYTAQWHKIYEQVKPLIGQMKTLYQAKQVNQVLAGCMTDCCKTKEYDKLQEYVAVAEQIAKMDLEDGTPLNKAILQAFASYWVWKSSTYHSGTNIQKQYYKECERQCKKLIILLDQENLEQVSIWKQYDDVYYDLADLYGGKRDIRKKIKVYNKWIAVRSRIAATDPSNLLMQFALYDLYYTLGTCYLQIYQYRKGNIWLKKYFDAAKKLQEEGIDSNTVWDMFAKSSWGIAQSYYHRLRFQKAEEYLKIGIEMFEKKDPESKENKNNLYNIEMRELLAAIYTSQSKMELAIENYEWCQKKRESLFFLDEASQKENQKKLRSNSRMLSMLKL